MDFIRCRGDSCSSEEFAMELLTEEELYLKLSQKDQEIQEICDKILMKTEKKFAKDLDYLKIMLDPTFGKDETFRVKEKVEWIRSNSLVALNDMDESYMHLLASIANKIFNRICNIIAHPKKVAEKERRDEWAYHMSQRH